MKFDKSKVYSAVNADEVKVGSLGYFADTLESLKEYVERELNDTMYEIISVESSSENYRFKHRIEHSDTIFSIL